MTGQGPVRLGVLGVGVLAQRVLRHLMEPDVRDQVEVVAVCDSVAARVEAVGKKWQIPHVCVDYDEMLALPELEAVSIATPIGLHWDHAVRAVRAGKHVHVNKTMTTTVAEASSLIEEATKAGVCLVASPGELLRPEVRSARRRVARGEIGVPEWAFGGAAMGTYHEDEAERRPDAGPLSPDPEWYFQASGGGPLYDGSVYQLHRLTSILGPVTKVSGMARLCLPSREFGGKTIECTADDTMLMLLEFASGVLGFAYGVLAGNLGGAARGSVFGTTGSVTDGAFSVGLNRAAVLQDDDGASEGFPHVNEAHAALREHHVFEDVMQLVEWIRSGVPSVVRAEQARHVVDIIESATRSAKSGAAEHLTTSFEWSSTGQPKGTAV